MRILVVSNFFPPYHIGGYELGCRDVVDALRGRGHDVRVLTSSFGVEQPTIQGYVHRCLLSDLSIDARNRASSLLNLFVKERRNGRAFEDVVERFGPELIYVWNPVTISLAVVEQAERSGVPVCYFISDRWLAKAPLEDRWYQLWTQRLRHGRSRLLWPFLRGMAAAWNLPIQGEFTRFGHVQLVSRFLLSDAEAAGKDVVDSAVVHWGVDAEQFPFRAARPAPGQRLLYVGQVMPHKGVHTAVEAIRILREKYGWGGATLDIFGGSTSPAYVAELERTVEQFGLAEAVRFHGGVARSRLQEIYAEHDVLVFPSVWEEPFSITLLEAMSSGLPVVSTATGGSGEIIVDGGNALLFAPERPGQCAYQVNRLLGDAALYEAIRTQARTTVEHQYRFETMVDRLEGILRSVVSGRKHPTEPRFAA